MLQSVKLEDKFFGEGMVIVDNTVGAPGAGGLEP